MQSTKIPLHLQKSLMLTANKLLAHRDIVGVKIQVVTNENSVFTVESGTQPPSIDFKKLRNQLALQIRLNTNKSKNQ